MRDYSSGGSVSPASGGQAITRTAGCSASHPALRVVEVLVAAGLAAESPEGIAEESIPFSFDPGTEPVCLGGNPRRDLAPHLAFELQIRGKPVLADRRPTGTRRLP